MLQVLISFCVFLFFGGVCSYVAKNKGRNPVMWYILGMLFCLLALIVLSLLPSLKTPAQISDETEENEDEKLSGSGFDEKKILAYQQNEWFYLGEDKQPKGPVGFNDLKTLWMDGLLESRSFVWTEGMVNWKRISEMVGLEDALLPSFDYSGFEAPFK